MAKRKVEHSLGRTIRGLREDLGMSQAQLAADAELSQGYLSQIENDEVLNLGTAVLFRLAAALVVDPKVIMEATGYLSSLEHRSETICFSNDPGLVAFIGKQTPKVQEALAYFLASFMGKPLDASTETGPITNSSAANLSVKKQRGQKLGKKIKYLRDKIPRTQGELAMDAGISQGYLSDLEKGDAKNPSIRVLLRIAKALKVDPDVLFEAAGFLTAKRQQELYQANEERIQPDLATFLSELSKPQQRRLLLFLKALEGLIGSEEMEPNSSLAR